MVIGIFYLYKSEINPLSFKNNLLFIFVSLPKFIIRLCKTHTYVHVEEIGGQLKGVHYLLLLCGP